MLCVSRARAKSKAQRGTFEGSGEITTRGEMRSLPGPPAPLTRPDQPFACDSLEENGPRSMVA
jgi:hypothetical protein